jgi:hypothetical protein
MRCVCMPTVEKQMGLTPRKHTNDLMENYLDKLCDDVLSSGTSNGCCRHERIEWISEAVGDKELRASIR